MNDNTSTSTVTDTIESYNGTLYDGGVEANTSTKSVTGKINLALKSDGNDDDYVDITTLGTFGSGIASGISVAFWIKTTNTNKDVLFGTFNDGSNTAIQLWVNADKDANLDAGELLLYLRDEDAKILQGGTTNDTSFNDGSWHHYVITIDSPNNTFVLYEDGTSVGISYALQQTADNFTDFQYAMALFARNSRGTIGEETPADLDDFRIYNEILTQAQVDAIWNNGNGTEGAGPASWSYIIE